MKTLLPAIALFLSILLTGCVNLEANSPQPSGTTETAAKEAEVSEPLQTQKLTGEKENYEDFLFDTPESTCFSRIGYIEGSMLLIVEFRESGSIYEYSCFTAEDWDNFSSAASFGGYYNKQIKGNYPCERIY